VISASWALSNMPSRHRIRSACDRMAGVDFTDPLGPIARADPGQLPYAPVRVLRLKDLALQIVGYEELNPVPEAEDRAMTGLQRVASFFLQLPVPSIVKSAGRNAPFVSHCGRRCWPPVAISGRAVES
jgi:hypothetical protein